MSTYSGSDKQHPAGERRQATILFADISGFTAMSEKLDPEEVSALMSDLFALFGTIIANHGGVIDKFIGDCVMALFGVPKAIEGAPQKAVSTALRMREEILAFNQRRGLEIPLSVHIGINSGEVLSGAIGSNEKKDFTVMGDAVNLAARLEELSTAGQILVGPLTYRYCRTMFQFTPLRPVSLKGKAQTVQVYEVLGEAVKGQTDEAGSDRFIQSELVGRKEELASLLEKAADLAKGTGSIVNVIGEAGLGKSRLCAEFSATGITETVTLLEGRALSVGRTLSYYPIIGILKAWASVMEEDSEEQALSKLEASIRTVAPDQATEIFPYAALLMGYKVPEQYGSLIEGVSGGSLGKIIAKNLKDLIVKACGLKPIVFMLEDMHWADESTFELLLSFAGLTEKHPVLFVLVYRPGYEETTERLHRTLVSGFPDRCIDIELTALNGAESETLALNLLKGGGFPEPITRQIITRSEGNPFFIEEVIRSFIDTGVIKTGKQGFIIGEGIEGVTIPHSINEVIMARIDRLDEDTREILRAASVIGRAFFYRVLSRVMGTDGEVRERLDHLKDLQLIRERMRMKELEFLFKHALAQEAVYRSILIKKRKEVHLAVARAIEEIFADRLIEFFGVLAYHYSQGEDLTKAEEYLEKAGAAALESAASSEALIFFQQALSIYKSKLQSDVSSEKLIMLERNIAKAFHNKGLYVEAIKHYDTALEYLGRKKKGKLSTLIEAVSGFLSFLTYLYLPFTRSKKTPDEKEVEIIQIIYDKCWALTLVDATECFIISLIAMRLIFRVNPMQIPIGREMLCTGSILFSGGGISFKIAKKILDTIEPELHDDNDRYMFLDAEQYVNFTSGMLSCSYDEKAVDFFARQGNFSRVNNYLAFWGTRFIYKGQIPKFLELSEKLQEIAATYNNESSMIFHYEIIVRQCYHLNKTTEGMRVNEKLIALLGKLGEKTLEKLNYAKKLDLLLQAGKFEKAGEAYNHIKMFIGEETFFPVQIVPTLMSMTAYLLTGFERMKSTEGKKALLKEMKPVVRKMQRYGKKFFYQYAGVCRLAGVHYWYIGKQRRAFRWWKEGLLTAEKLELKPELGRIYCAIGKCLEEPGSKVKNFENLPPEHYLEKAQKILTEIGMEWTMETSPAFV